MSAGFESVGSGVVFFLELWDGGGWVREMLNTEVYLEEFESLGMVRTVEIGWARNNI